MVPNLPSPVVIPGPGTPTAPDVDGVALEFFAKLLGSGPSPAVIAGPGTMPADEVTLRAAPADSDAQGGDAEAARRSVPDIIRCFRRRAAVRRPARPRRYARGSGAGRCRAITKSTRDGEMSRQSQRGTRAPAG